MVRRWWGAALALALALALAALVPVGPASAAGTVYYVDNAPGANCSDGGGGTVTTPFCDFAPVNALQRLQPGDEILIARGTSYDDQRLRLFGAGDPSQPNVISAYGPASLPRPHLSLSSMSKTDRARWPIIRLQNPSYWQVSQLELSDAGAGVLAQYRSSFSQGSYLGNHSLVFSDLYVHNIAGIALGNANGGDMGDYGFDCTGNATYGQKHEVDTTQDTDQWTSAGVQVTGAWGDQVPASSYFVDGVVFRNIEGDDDLNVVGVDNCGAKAIADSNLRIGAPQPQLVRNVLVDNVWAHDGNGSGYQYQCSEIVRLNGVTGVTVMNSRLQRMGDCYVKTGTAGIILVSVDDVTLVNNVISDVERSSSPDQTGVDHELYVHGVYFYDNLIARNAGPGMEYLFLRNNISDYDDGNLVVDNSFYGNDVSLDRKQCGDPVCATFPSGGTVSGNLEADPTMFSPSESSFTARGWTVGDNAQLAPDEVPHYAADEFSPLQAALGWTYQVTQNAGDPSAWTDATFRDGEHVSGVWAGNGSLQPGAANPPQIARFEQTPGSCSGCASARVWTAPRDGTVVIKGRAIQPDGTVGSSVQIQRNDVPVGPTSHLTPGVFTGVTTDQTVTVHAGDQLRFVVTGDANPNDEINWVSWVPSIGYVDPAPTSTTGDVADSGFETPQVGSGSIQYAPGGATWSFSPTVAGIQGAGLVGNGSAFNNPNAPVGSQAAFVQQHGWVSQTLSGLRPGVEYQIAMLADNRTTSGPAQILTVLVDGQQVGGPIVPWPNGYASYQSAPFTVGSGVHTITIKGVAADDATAFVDNLHVVEAPSTQFSNASFEVPQLPAGQSQGNPAPLWGWRYTSDSGVFSNGAFSRVPTAPRGSQGAYVTDGGSITGSFSALPGTVYSVVFSAAQRSTVEQSGTGQTLVVTASSPGSTATTSVAPSNPRWQTYATPPVTVGSTGTVTLTFSGTAPYWNPSTMAWQHQTVLLDDVRVVPATPVNTDAASDASFETPAMQWPSYPYGWSYGPIASSGWSFQGSLSHGGAGISRNGSAFGSTASDGSQVAFIQRDAMLASNDTWLAAGHTYAVSLDAEQRTTSGGPDRQDLRVQVDGVPYLVWEPSSAWETRTFVVTVPPGAQGRLEVVGTHSGTDNTAFVDNIRVARLG